MKIVSSTPRLIVIGGFAGAGKSTLGRSLSRALALPVYEIDLVAQAISDSLLDAHPRALIVVTHALSKQP